MKNPLKPTTGAASARRFLTLFLLVPLALVAPVAQAAEDNRSAEERALEQVLSADEPVVAGQKEIAAGHVDMGPAFVEGSWELLLRDDSGEKPVWRDPADVVLRGNDSAAMTVPDDPRYSFVQAATGEEVFVIPQTEVAGVVWPGWNTQNPQVVERLGRGVTLTLEGVEGPGEFSLYLESGTFGPPEVLWTSDTSEPQDIFVEPNAHTHANWVFTAPGAYYLTVRAHAELADGSQVSDTAQLLFAVGSEVSTEQVFAGAAALESADGSAPGGSAEPTAADGQADTPEVAPQNPAGGPSSQNQASKSTDNSTGLSPLGLGLLLGALILLALLAGSYLLARRSAAAKSAALRQTRGEGDR